MTHRRARSWMALAAGGDLGLGRQRRLEEHLAACTECRKEFRTYQEALGLAASLATEDKTPDWTDSEWRRAIGRALGQEPEKRRASRLRLPGWARAGAAALLIVALLGAAMLLKRTPGPRLTVEQTRTRDAILPDNGASSPAAARKPAFVPSQPAPGWADRLLARSAVLPQTQQRAPSASATPGVPPPTQTVMAMTFVSQETGLIVHWTFNDNFNYQEDKK